MGGDAGAIAGAAIYATSNILSWKEAKDMPKLQAEANKKVLDEQKRNYDKLSKEQRDILNAAIDRYLRDTRKILDSDDFKEAFPDVPEAAEYVPIDACCIQGSTIECNISHTQRADDYVRWVNRKHEQNDLVHALASDPRFLITLDIQSKSINDLTRGILPVGDVVDVLCDNAEQASLTGRIGNTRKTTARDLGITKLRAMSAGRKEFREATAWANSSVSPLQRQADIRTMMQVPQDRVNLALHQSQLIQQSLQNLNNALAQKKQHKLPKLQAELQRKITRLQAKSSEALLVNTHLPNPALTVPPPSMSNVSGLVGAIGQTIQSAQKSHFFGGPSGSQDGYTSAYTGQAATGSIDSNRLASDRPPGF